MSKKSSRYSDPKNRKPKVQREADKALHKSKKERQRKMLEEFGI